MKNIFNLKIVRYSVLNILLIFGTSFQLDAKGKYWVVLAQEASCENQQKLNLEQLQDSLLYMQLKPEVLSNWLQAISVELTHEQVDVLQEKCYIEAIKGLSPLYVKSYHEDLPKLSYALEQIKAQAIIDAGYSGKNVKIAIIDGGFMDADLKSNLSHALPNVVLFRDYINSENKEAYRGVKKHIDYHGTNVWNMIAGNDTAKPMQFGLATDATFYLYRTDHGKREFRAEEDYFVQALEHTYEQGVKLVNVSLGYARDFDDKSENHEADEVDGESSMITKAVNIAGKEKGMLLVIAAGNEGNDKTWQILSLPADSPHALAVGATQYSDWRKSGYSSIGPEKLAFVKPDIACFASNGTSYAAPVITGLAACIWEADSTLTNFEMMQIIKQSAHLWEVPNNYLGHGVPDAEKILQQLKSGEMQKNKVKYLKGDADAMIINADTEDKWAVFFHKTDKRNVSFQEVHKIADGKIKVNKHKDIVYTTISIREQVFEISWE